MLLGVGAAVAVAVASVALPEPLLLALVAACAAVSILLLARRYVNPRPSLGVGGKSSTQASQRMPFPPAIVSERSDSLVVARFLFYAGMLTIGQTAVRPWGGFTVSDWLFFTALWAALVGLALGRGTVTFRIPALVILGVVLYVVAGLLSTFQALAPLASAANVARFAYLTLVWFWLATLRPHATPASPGRDGHVDGIARDRRSGRNPAGPWGGLAVREFSHTGAHDRLRPASQ